MSKPKITETDISKLTPDPNNARKRTPLSASVIRKSLEQFGAARSIVVDENDVIRAGNGTFEEAGQLGIEKVVTIEVDGNTIVAVKRKGLTEEQWKQYAIADNTASDFSTWDFDILSELTQEVDLSEFFPDDKLNELLEQLGKGESFGVSEQGEENEEEIAELLDKVDEIESRVKLGEIWQLGRHKIACGDSTVESNVRALLGDRFGDVGMVWADPPYGMSYQSNYRTKSKKFAKIDGDETPLIDFIPCIKSFPVWYICCRWDVASDFMTAIKKQGHKIINWIVWHKPKGSMGDLEAAYRPTHETILYCSSSRVKFACEGRDCDMWTIDTDNPSSYVHPTQKPVSLLERAFNNHLPKGTICFDPFLGSAPSIIAAQKMEGDRTVYGFELSPAYCEVILQRFEKLTGIEPKLIGKLPD